MLTPVAVLVAVVGLAVVGRAVALLMVAVRWHLILLSVVATRSSGSVSAGWDADSDMRVDVRKGAARRGVGTEMSSPASEGELDDLRRRMVASAARHLPHADAEDVTQEALLRLVRDSRPSTVPLSARAFRKLRDSRAELARNNQRKFEQGTLTPEEATGEAAERVEAMAALIGLEQIVTEVAGGEVMCYARLKTEGLSDAEIAAQPGWDARRVDAARKKLSRKKGQLAKLIKESASE
jgi:DNA-directed RNA polymerase specialized sigma24 family protein